jgi:hypothetical protein
MKSESVLKLLVIVGALLIVASVVVAVAVTSNGADSSALNCKNPKLSTEVADIIPPLGIAPPAEPITVNIYLTENRSEYVEELRNYVIDIVYIKGTKVVAEIYIDKILDIANLPFVTYIEKTLTDIPLIYEPPAEDVVGSLSIDTYKDPKLSTEVSDNIPPPGIAPPAEPMTVNIYLTENKVEYIDELGNYVINILYIKGTKVVAEIYTDKILEIKNLPFVTYVETTLMDIPLPVFPEACSDGNLSEGVRCLDADTVRNSTGKGVKVAIIDGGFTNHKQCLPGVVNAENVISYRGDGSIEISEHGTACAEIVHQVAPDAELYLINYDAPDKLRDIVEDLTTWNVDIVTRSLAQCWGLFDGTDEVCRVIDDAVNHGIVWVNGAGNSAEAHWEGTFTDSDGDGWHEFPGEGGELGQKLYVNPKLPPFVEGDPVTLLLSWNGSWNNETQDYDIYIFDESREAVARSIDPQMGLNGHKSFEAIEWMPASRGWYNIVIRNCNATKPVHFELYIWPWGTTPSCNVKESSLCIDATAFRVIAAGAVNKGGVLESYSSRGATNDGRIKPDFVAPVGYDTCAKSGPFTGTSAASPYVAGELALLLSWIRETKTEQNGTAYELIEPYLDDIANTTEPNNETGYGRFPQFWNSS